MNIGGPDMHINYSSVYMSRGCLQTPILIENSLTSQIFEIVLRQFRGPEAGCYEHNNEPLNSAKGRNFLTS
jgi:hypothetical protein